MGADQLRSLARAALAAARPTPSYRLGLATLAPLVPPELVWPEMAIELADAEARGREPLDRKTVERVLRDAWGVKPADELDDLDHEPAAVTPTGQVHRGELDGAAVAVKVVRPGVAEARRNDLRVVDALAGAIDAAFPAVDVAAVVREVRERIEEELDLEHEGDAARRLARGLRGHERLMVPMPVTRLTAHRVLVSEWVEGRPLAEADPGEAARALVRFHVGSARFGLVHADPHPEHVLALGGGRFAFLDAGASRSVDAARVDLGVAALDALAGDDAEAFARAVDRLGWLPADVAREAHALARELLDGFLDGPATLDIPALVRMRGRAEARFLEGAEIAARATVPPEDLWPVRMLGALFLTVAPLGVTADWVALVREAAVEGW